MNAGGGESVGSTGAAANMGVVAFLFFFEAAQLGLFEIKTAAGRDESECAVSAGYALACGAGRDDVFWFFCGVCMID